MTQQPDRTALIREYKENPRPAGIFQVKNTATGRSLVGRTNDLSGMLNRKRYQLEMGSKGGLMVHVTYYVASSIDGLIAPTDGSLGWLSPFSGTGEDHGYTGFYASVDALVVGARTYEQMLGFGEWPHQDKPVTVMSSRPLPAAGGGITVSSLGPGEVMEELVSAGHRRIWLVGGGALASSFAAAGLIDEYIISYLPVLLGSGIGLLGGHGDAQSLHFIEAETFGDGIVQCRYRARA